MSEANPDPAFLHTLITPRLRLAALSPGALRELIEQPAVLEARLDLPLVAQLVTPPARRAIGIKLEKMAAAPVKAQPWFTYWLIIFTRLPLGIGLAGFKGIPDADGAVEIGYGMAESQQGHGYMSEAVWALIDWAFQQPACRAVTACQVRHDNVASQQVLLKAGMRRFAEDPGGLSFRIDRTAIG